MVYTEDPDIVILELSLRDISGLDVLRRIRSFSSVPVIILSVHHEETIMTTALDIGADDYVMKPFRLAELEARIESKLRWYNYIDKSENRAGYYGQVYAEGGGIPKREPSEGEPTATC